MLPSEAAGCIFFSLPDPNAPPTWHYLGFLTNQKPSAIYKLNNLTQSKLDSRNGETNNNTSMPNNGIIAFNYLQSPRLVAQIGISIESLTSEVASMAPAIETTVSKANSFTEFINKTVGNLYNYCLSFSRSAEEVAASQNSPFQPLGGGNGGNTQYVPLKCIQTWYENYTRRLSNDQNYWKTLSSS